MVIMMKKKKATLEISSVNTPGRLSDFSIPAKSARAC